MAASSSGTALTKFLRRYSTRSVVKNLCRLYGQWRVTEIRDAGKRRYLRCHCGRGNLRYIAFIENIRTGVQTYVGSDCVKYFSRQTVPSVLKILEGIAIHGLSAIYLGRKGCVQRFRLDNISALVRHKRLLRHFFRCVPLRRCPKGYWEVRMCMSGKKKRLLKCHRYRINVGAATPLEGKKKGQKPRLILYMDGVQAC